MNNRTGIPQQQIYGQPQQMQQMQQQPQQMQQMYQPQFKQYAVGSGIDNNEYQAITKGCTQAYINKANPLSTNSATFIKQSIGGEWFVCCSPLGNKNFDFCLSSVSGGDFMSFSLDNVLFEVCRLK
jgi:hypothetical protein